MSNQIPITQFDEDDGRTPKFACPCCGEDLSAFFKFRLTVTNVKKFEYTADDERPKGEAPGDAGKAAALRAVFEGSPLMPAFEAALRAAPMAPEPGSDPWKRLAVFLQTAAPFNIQHDIVDRYAREYGRPLTFVKADHVVAVLAAGEIREFIPQIKIAPPTLNRLLPKAEQASAFAGVKVSADVREVDIWIRTKFGYVAGRGMFFDELRKRSKGDFDAARGKVRQLR